MNNNQTKQWEKWHDKRKTEYSSREIAYQYIKNKIINLEYAPGCPLSDKLLAEELEMSRTPIREALLLLTAKNMVVVKPQSGTYVAPIDIYWIEMEQFKRYAMEKEVVTQALSKMTDEFRMMYEETLTAYKEEMTYESLTRDQTLLKLDNAFHSIAFVAAGKEDHYFDMMEDMLHFERFRSLSLRQKDSRPLDTEHRELANAIMEGRQIEALYLLEKHLFGYRNQIESLKNEFPEYFTIG